MEVKGFSDRRTKEPGHHRPVVRSVECIFIAVVFISFLSTETFAQEALRPPIVRPEDSLRVSSLGFDRVQNTFTWNGSLLFDRDVSGIEFKLWQLLRSRLIRTDPLSIQDEYR